MRRVVGPLRVHHLSGDMLEPCHHASRNPQGPLRTAANLRSKHGSHSRAISCHILPSTKSTVAATCESLEVFLLQDGFERPGTDPVLEPHASNDRPASASSSHIACALATRLTHQCRQVLNRSLSVFLKTTLPFTTGWFRAFGQKAGSVSTVCMSGVLLKEKRGNLWTSKKHHVLLEW